MPARTLALPATVFLTAALVVGGCGGTAATPTGPEGEATPTPTVDVQPTDGGTPTDLPFPSDFALPSFDLGSLVTNLDNVDSYRVVIVAQDQETYTGIVVTKPVLARDLRIGTGADATHIVTIGDESWIGSGDGPLQSAPSAILAGMLPLFDPTVLLAAFANQSLMSYAENLGEEQKNGQSTTHYRVKVSDIPNYGALGAPPDAVIETWVSDDGYLVSFITSGIGPSGSDLAIDVTNVNDPANVVDRP